VFSNLHKPTACRVPLQPVRLVRIEYRLNLCLQTEESSD
jgi:hypothetical protein